MNLLRLVYAMEFRKGLLFLPSPDNAFFSLSPPVTSMFSRAHPLVNHALHIEGGRPRISVSSTSFDIRRHASYVIPIGKLSGSIIP